MQRQKETAELVMEAFYVLIPHPGSHFFVLSTLQKHVYRVNIKFRMRIIDIKENYTKYTNFWNNCHFLINLMNRLIFTKTEVVSKEYKNLPYNS